MTTTQQAVEAMASECPECGARVVARRRPLNGEVMACPDCGIDLEVVCTDPLRLETAPPVQEDWGE